MSDLPAPIQEGGPPASHFSNHEMEMKGLVIRDSCDSALPKTVESALRSDVPALACFPPGILPIISSYLGFYDVFLCVKHLFEPHFTRDVIIQGLALRDPKFIEEVQLESDPPGCASPRSLSDSLTDLFHWGKREHMQYIWKCDDTQFDNNTSVFYFHACLDAKGPDEERAVTASHSPIW